MNKIQPADRSLGRMFVRAVAFAVVVLLLVSSAPVFAQEGSEDVNTLPNIVLVHGAWADGASWSGVIERLQARGYNVIAPQFALASIEDDATHLRQILNSLTGPTIVAGQSYGGLIMTALGTDAPNVVGLVYVCGWAHDAGDTIQSLTASYTLSPALTELRIDDQGFAWITQENYRDYFAADVDAVQANVMYATQHPFSTRIFGETIEVPAWRELPSWYLVCSDDQMIPPDLQRFFTERMGATVVEIPSSHVAMVSHPDETTALIEAAAQTVSVSP
jgi:pimeloyl-ACP methyl ester carboxylesterase